MKQDRTTNFRELIAEVSFSRRLHQSKTGAQYLPRQLFQGVVAAVVLVHGLPRLPGQRCLGEELIECGGAVQVPIRTAPAPSWIHDFPVAQNYAIVPETPVIMNMKVPFASHFLYLSLTLHTHQLAADVVTPVMETVCFLLRRKPLGPFTRHCPRCNRSYCKHVLATMALCAAGT